MELLQKFVDAVCAIAQEMKIGNDLKRQELAAPGVWVEIPADKARVSAPDAIVELPEADAEKAERAKLQERAKELGLVFTNRTRTATLKAAIEEAEGKPAKAATETKAAEPDDVFDISSPAPAEPVTLEQLQSECRATMDFFMQQAAPATPDEVREMDNGKIAEDRRPRALAAIRTRVVVTKAGGARELKNIPVERYGEVAAALRSVRG